MLLRDNQPYKILGRGIIGIKMFDGCVRLLDNVKYNPRLKRNLVYIGTLDFMGYVMKINGIIKVIKDIMNLMNGTISATGLYILKGHTIYNVDTIADTKMASSSKLWHQRLGHINAKGLVELSKRGILFGTKF